MVFTQENRLIRVDTPLGNDVLLLEGFSGSEGLSNPFSFELKLLSENHSIIFSDIIGQNVTISVNLAESGTKRFFNGIISRFSQVQGSVNESGNEHFSSYTATMVPWLWLLTRTADSRIFQRLSVPEIIEQIFTEKGFGDFEMQTSGSYDKRDYCVQYRETDFNFISRLLEEEGIYYFFKHVDGKHTLVMADLPGEHKVCPGQESARYYIGDDALLEEDTIEKLELTQEIQVGKYTLNDYNFEMPGTSLKAEIPGQQELGPGEREVYDYPGGYSKKADGERLTNIRMQEEEAEITTVGGAGNCRAFTSGYKFTLIGYYRRDMNDKEFVLTSVTHKAYQGFIAGDMDSELSYNNSFSCIPFEVPFRPGRKTRKPIVEGVQTAIVVGPSGEEIYTDEHGRVKAQFHWDREGNNNENSSCWIRVSQVWAGGGWGAMYIPRIGHEVIVDFEEGDPDSPIITGRVYHGNNRPPYDLPAEKTKSTIKSNSSPGGGGNNEFRFEDKAGEEEIFLHGQKDWDTVIENNKTQKIGNNEAKTVGNNRTKKIGKDEKNTIGDNRTENVGKNEEITIGANRTESVGKDEKITIGANRTENVAKNEEITIGANRTETVAKNEEITIGDNRAETVGKDDTLSIGGDRTLSVDKDNTISITKKHSLTASNIFMNADEDIVIKTGSASITMQKNGKIKIKGSEIKIKASGNVIIKSSKISGN